MAASSSSSVPRVASGLLRKMLSPRSPSLSQDMLEDVEDHNINYRDDIGLGDEKLVTLSTKDLNKMLKKRGISKDRAKEIKRERRTLKNRGYAANCRVKREDEEKSLEQENERLYKLITYNQRLTQEHRRETQILKDKVERGMKEIREMKKIEDSEITFSILGWISKTAKKKDFFCQE